MEGRALREQSPRIQEFRSGLPILLTAMVGLACGTAGALYAFAYFVEPLMLAHGATRTQVAGWASTYTATVLVTAPWIGRLTDRYGARWTATVSFAGLGVAYAYAAFAPPGLFTLYSSAVLVAALGGGTLPITLTKVIADRFHEARGLALGLALCGVLIGVTVASKLLPDALDRGGLSAGYLVLVAFALLALPVVALGLREGKHAPGYAIRAATGLSMQEAAKTPVFWLLGASFLTFCLASTGVVVHFVAAMGERGIDPKDTSQYFAILSAGSLVGRLAIGALIDRVFAPSLLFALFALTAVACYVLPTIGIAYIALAVLVLGFAIGAEVDLISYLTASYFGMRHYGQVYGVLYAVFAMGSAVGPPLVSVLRESFGGYVEAFAVCAGFMLLSATLFLPIARYRFLEAPDDPR